MPVRSFTNGGNPTRRSVLSPLAGWPTDEAELNGAQRGLGNILPAEKPLPVAKAEDELTRFERLAVKAFPDLMLTVSVANKRTGLGWAGRTYVLRASGQALGAEQVEAKAASIELAIESLIRLVAPVRRAATAAREEAARTRHQRAA